MSWWVPQWVRNAFYSIGLWERHATLVFLGLDNAGKTTLLSLLTDGRLHQHMPTQKPTEERLQYGNCAIQAHDLGGHALARRLWAEYCLKVDGVLFLVDTADRTRFGEARDELAGLLAMETLATTPIAVLGNKIDLPGAASEMELKEALGLGPMSAGQPVEVFMASIIRRTGYREAFEWLTQFVK